jgi:uncharacterized protein (DUF2225 family)
VIGSTNNFGGIGTDLRQFAAGSDPVTLEIQTCLSCGFSGLEHDFRNELDSSTIQRIVLEIKPRINEDCVGFHQSYEFAAWIASWQNRPKYDIAQLYHCAAWCCDGDDQLAESMSKYQRTAAGLYRQSLGDGEIPSEQIPIYTYLVGELFRRADEPDSAEWLQNAEALAKKAGDTDLEDLAHQQRTDPKEMIQSKPVFDS